MGGGRNPLGELGKVKFDATAHTASPGQTNTAKTFAVKNVQHFDIQESEHNKKHVKAVLVANSRSSWQSKNEKQLRTRMKAPQGYAKWVAKCEAPQGMLGGLLSGITDFDFMDKL